MVLGNDFRVEAADGAGWSADGAGWAERMDSRKKASCRAFLLGEWSWGMDFLVDGWTRAGHRLGNGVGEWVSSF